MNLTHSSDETAVQWALLYLMRLRVRTPFA
jgi:hypothetical protein